MEVFFLFNEPPLRSLKFTAHLAQRSSGFGMCMEQRLEWKSEVTGKRSPSLDGKFNYSCDLLVLKNTILECLECKEPEPSEILFGVQTMMEFAVTREMIAVKTGSRWDKKDPERYYWVLWSDVYTQLELQAEDWWEERAASIAKEKEKLETIHR